MNAAVVFKLRSVFKKSFVFLRWFKSRFLLTIVSLHAHFSSRSNRNI